MSCSLNITFTDNRLGHGRNGCNDPHYDHINTHRIPFPDDIEAVLKVHRLKYVKHPIDIGNSQSRNRGDIVHYVVDHVVRRLMNEQFQLNEADGKSHFVHERRLSVIVDRRCGGNTLWFVHFLCEHVNVNMFTFLSSSFFVFTYLL